jgi:hypothetical protein
MGSSFPLIIILGKIDNNKTSTAIYLMTKLEPGGPNLFIFVAGYLFQELVPVLEPDTQENHNF